MSEAERPCDECGGPLPATARTSTKFCSPSCRQKAYRARLVDEETDYRRDRFGRRRCDFCPREIPFTRARNGALRLTRDDAAYCSARCRQKAYRLRLNGQKLREELGIRVPRRLTPRRRRAWPRA